jgi:Na+/proline symporter
MFYLTLWDGLIVAAYVAFCLIVAFSLKRRGERHGLKSYVAADRNMPWWLLGTSMVATTFSAETPLLISGWVYESGISRNWEWWCFLPGAMLTTFLFARLWRRTEVLTDAEYITFRYSGREAEVLRGFRAIYMGLIVNTIMIGSQFFVCGKIGTILLGLAPGDPHYEAWRNGIPIACALVAMTSSALAGISGILVTDFVMFILKLLAAILVCVYAVTHSAVGGLANLKSQISNSHPDFLNFLPNLHGGAGAAQLTLGALALYLTVRWWAQVYGGAEPGGGVYVAQRMLSAKNERHALLATLWFNIAHYAVRPWPWILTALACVFIFPHARNGEEAYIQCITLVPPGVRGLVLAGFFAALMAVDTRLNLGAAYLVNDLYKPYLAQGRSDRHYVFMSRLGTCLLIVTALFYAHWITRVKSTFFITTAIGSGSGLVYILRWYWWRVNAWSEIAAMSAAIVCAAVFRLAIYPSEESFNAHGFQVLLISAGAVTAVWLVVTLLTPAGDMDKLKQFYRRVRPAGPFWGPIAAQVRAEDGPTAIDPGYSLARALCVLDRRHRAGLLHPLRHGKCCWASRARLALLLPAIPRSSCCSGSLQSPATSGEPSRNPSPQRSRHEVAFSRVAVCSPVRRAPRADDAP